MDRLEFAGLIAARLCHDLAGSISALANGAELLADETDETVRAEFVAMMGVGAGKLAARLRFLRLVFGSGGDAPVAIEEARGALSDYLAAEGRVPLDWSGAGPPLERLLARLLLALALVALDALERGGRLAIEQGPEGWSVRATGPQVALAAEGLAVLRGNGSTSGGFRSAAAHLAAALARSSGITILIAECPGEARLSLSKTPGQPPSTSPG